MSALPDTRFSQKTLFRVDRSLAVIYHVQLCDSNAPSVNAGGDDALCGWLKNWRVEEDGPIMDLHLNEEHPLTAKILEAASRAEGVCLTRSAWRELKAKDSQQGDYGDIAVRPSNLVIHPASRLTESVSSPIFSGVRTMPTFPSTTRGIRAALRGRYLPITQTLTEVKPTAESIVVSKQGQPISQQITEQDAPSSRLVNLLEQENPRTQMAHVDALRIQRQMRSPAGIRSVLRSR